MNAVPDVGRAWLRASLTQFTWDKINLALLHLMLTKNYAEIVDFAGQYAISFQIQMKA